MKTAFAFWKNRIAPVFDTARQIHVVEADSGQVVRETDEMLGDDMPVRKTLRLVELRIGAVVCGAISRPLQGIIVAHGVEVIPFVAGDLQEVIRAWLSGNLECGAFAMPGCCGRGSRRQGGIHEVYKEVNIMNGQGRGMGAGGGAGKGAGQGRGRTGQGRGQGRMGDTLAGETGTCECPKCGHREPHERGVPCLQKQCPKCGIAMTRQ